MGAIREWIIEYDEQDIGRLVNGQAVEQFWDEYDVVPFDDISEELTRALWDSKCWLDFRFRDPDTGQTSDAAFGLPEAAERHLTKSKIVLRGLYTESDLEKINSTPTNGFMFEKSVAFLLAAIVVFAIIAAAKFLG